MKNSSICCEGAQPLPRPHPIAAYGASILASLALDLRPPNVPVALTPMAARRCRAFAAVGPAARIDCCTAGARQRMRAVPRRQPTYRKLMITHGRVTCCVSRSGAARARTASLDTSAPDLALPQELATSTPPPPPSPPWPVSVSTPPSSPRHHHHGLSLTTPTTTACLNTTTTTTTACQHHRHCYHHHHHCTSLTTIATAC